MNKLFNNTVNLAHFGISISIILTFSKAISRINVSVVHIQNIDTMIIHEVPLMAISLEEIYN